MKFDLTVYAFETHQPRLLCTASAGKGAARGREEDSLIIKLWPSDAVSLSEEVLNQTLSKLAAAFFKTSGSVTNAMRSLADGLNKTFLSGNSQLQEKELTHHVKEYADKGIVNKQVVLLKVKLVEMIDRTSVGKINKVALREKHLQP